MLLPEMYLEASLVKANVSGYDLALSGMTVAEFKEQAIEENGLFVLAETTVGDDGVEHDEVRYFQSPEDRMPLNPVDTDAHWRTTRAGKASGLQYQENAIVDLDGSILSPREGIPFPSPGHWGLCGTSGMGRDTRVSPARLASCRSNAVKASISSGASKARFRRPTLTWTSTPAATRRSMAWLAAWKERPVSSAAVATVSTGAAGNADMSRKSDDLRRYAFKAFIDGLFTGRRETEYRL